MDVELTILLTSLVVVPCAVVLAVFSFRAMAEWDSYLDEFSDSL